MWTTVESTPPQASPVEAARVAIWRLYQEGYVDEDMATAGLLAVDLGTRRTQQRRTSAANQAHPTRATTHRHRVAA